VDLIFGKVSPSGRLPETLPVTVDQLPSHAFFPGTREVVEYREGLNVGYRYLDTVCSFDKSQVRYPFGHGLTYTEFEYSQLGITIKKDESSKKQVQIHFRLSNVGQVAAKEVPQCYVAPLHPSIHRPAHELKAFTKVHLHPGESQIVSFDLSQDAFAYYDIGHGAWTVELGEYEIQVGASSQDIRLQQTIAFQSGIPASNLAKESYPLEGGMSTDDEAFAKRFGPRKERVLDSIQQRNEPGREALTRLDRNSLLKEAATQSLLGKGLLLLVFKIGCREIPSGPMETAEVCLVRANVENLPLRSIILFSGGALSMEFMDTLIAIMNGKPLEAVRMFGTMIGCGIKGVFGR
jgi:beta-glucosidase